MKQLIIALCTANQHTWIGLPQDMPAGCIHIHRIDVADPPRVIEAMRTVFIHALMRNTSNYFDHRFVKPYDIARRISIDMALEVAA